MNGAIYTISTTLKSIVVSESEAELETLFMTAKIVEVIQLTLNNEVGNILQHLYILTILHLLESPIIASKINSPDLWKLNIFGRSKFSLIHVTIEWYP